MSALGIDREIVQLQNYISLAVYVHYYVPGSLRLRTLLQIPVVYKSDSFLNTRRWLQRGESPYPGYCRAPGSAKCLPILCDCEKLTEIWKSLMNTKELLKESFNDIT